MPTPPPDNNANPASAFSFAGMRRGIAASQPLAVGVFIYGAAFGLLAREAMLSLPEALLMSGVVYSGSAQLVAVSSMDRGTIPAGAAAAAVLATVFLLNARYVLYGAAMRPWLGGLPAYQAYPTLAVLGDGNWMLSMKASAAGESDAGYVFGSGLAMFIPWLGGTWIGSSAGALITQPAAIGLDFLLVAFSAAMGCGMFKGRSDLKIIAAAAAAALLTERLLSGGAAILAAGLAGAAVAWLTFPQDKDETATKMKPP
jgi:predicted branched-subunit amino acid permease